MADSEDLHPLLRRQARRAGIADPSRPPEDDVAWRDFLGRIGRTFESAERDRYLLERSLELSSEEMQELHARVARDRELLDSVLAALSAGVVHVDSAWRVSFVNAAGRRLLGLAEEPRGQISEIFTLESPGGTVIDLAESRRTLEGGSAVHHDDVFVVRRDQELIPASVTCNPIMRGDVLDGLVVSITDNTERKRALRDAQKARVEAEAAERARLAQAAFLANMSHELRTPLNAILGYSELVLEDAEALGYEEVVPDLKKIHTAGRHLLQLINDVLDMSKIQAGRLELTLADVGVTAVVREVVETVAPVAHKNGNVLEVVSGDDAGTVHTDALRLKQALINVIGNAGKFTHAGTVRISVESRPDSVTIGVEDTGIGMDEATVERIFEPFTQADSSTTRKYGGTGLGLAITHSICQALHISVEVRSELGKGTVFRLTMPREFAEVTAPDEPTIERAHPTRSGDDQVVLLIDDDRASHELMARYLAGNRIRLHTATTGRAGLELVRSMRPDAVILDIVLPDMQGWDVLSVLKGDPATSDIPLVVVSIVADAPRAYRLGAQEHLVKPIDRSRLLELLRDFRARTSTPSKETAP